MNDRFNFRAWVLGRRMIDVTEINFHECWLADDDDKQYDMINRTIIMQCTGLKDKNDKLIFEGDITILTSDRYYIVTWNPHLLRFDLSMPYNNDLNKRILLEKHYKIIGNIHENPELLT